MTHTNNTLQIVRISRNNRNSNKNSVMIFKSLRNKNNNNDKKAIKYTNVNKCNDAESTNNALLTMIVRMAKKFKIGNNNKSICYNNNSECSNNNCKISPIHMKMLDNEWKLSLFFVLNNCDLVCNFEIPFDILYLIIMNCEGTIRKCDVCDKELLDMRYTQGYGIKKLNKKIMRQYKCVLCCHCQEKVIASYQTMDQNLESLGMRGI